MSVFTLWHATVLFLVVGFFFFIRREPAAADSNAAAGVHLHSPTQYVCAALHGGRIDPQSTIERIEDRRKARLPELGLNIGRILTEAKSARRRNRWFSLVTLAVAAWLVWAVFDESGALILVLATGPAGLLLIGPPVTILLPLWAMAVLSFVKIVVVNRYLAARIIPLTDIPDDDTKQNVVIFGGYSPFAGYGVDLDNWSFTIDASKAGSEHGRRPALFPQVELLDHLSRELETNVVLGDSYDRLFVNGCRIRGQKLFLFDVTSMPNTAVSAEIMRSRIGRPDQDARHYRLYSVPYANGHLYLTYFIRSTMVGKNLFIECRCFLLKPLRPEFTGLNELPVKRGAVYLVGQLWKCLLNSVWEWLRGPMFVVAQINRLLGKISRWVFGDPQLKSEIYNYGQANSLREGWASQLYHTYFQLLDKDMIGKTCQHIIINSIVAFLDHKGIATDDIKERRTQIFNSGVIVHGGVVNAQQLAVGKGASVKAKIIHALSAKRR